MRYVIRTDNLVLCIEGDSVQGYRFPNFRKARQFQNYAKKVDYDDLPVSLRDYKSFIEPVSYTPPLKHCLYCTGTGRHTYALQGGRLTRIAICKCMMRD